MEHNEHSCGCGHPHDPPAPHCGCGCGASERADTPLAKDRPPLTGDQAGFLAYLSRYHCLPVARFLTLSSREKEWMAVSLAPVFIQTPQDTLEQVREMGALLTSLEEGGYLSIDYDLPVSGYEYREFRESDLYAYFCETVAQAAKREGFLGDTPALELGSMAPL